MAYLTTIPVTQEQCKLNFYNYFDNNHNVFDISVIVWLLNTHIQGNTLIVSMLPYTL